MKERNQSLTLILLLLLFLPAHAQIVIPAGTPEDQALQAISNEQDPAKKIAMYDDFLQKFASNPAAVAYGNWQMSQQYQTSGDLPKALDHGEKALAAAPNNLDILVSLVNVAQQMKDNSKVVDYSVRGGEAFNALEKEGKSDDEGVEKSSHDFLEAAAYNAIVDTSDAKTRMGYIERFTPAFPKSRFEQAIASYAMMSLAELNDMPRLVAYGTKTLETSPDNLPTLLLLANAYADDPKAGSLPKAATYAQKAISVAKADAPDADRSSKMSAGVAHSTLGFVYMKQDKTAGAIAELKTATGLLKGQDDQSFAMAAYRLGYAYAKLGRTTEARDALNESVRIAGPVQKPAQELLVKVNAARAKGR